MKRAKKLAYMGLLTASALALSFIESFFPDLFLPGAKLGLTNIITVAALYTFSSVRDAALVIAARVILGGIFAGGSSIFYSASGAALSFWAMALLKRADLFNIISVSAAGGFFHNLGQLLAASVFISSASVLALFPALALMGLAAGLAVGFTASKIVPRINSILQNIT